MAQCFLAKSGGGSGSNLKEIWSNPNPQDSFRTDTTINVPINDVVLIECCYSTTQNDLRCTFF